VEADSEAEVDLVAAEEAASPAAGEALGAVAQGEAGEPMNWPFSIPKVAHGRVVDAIAAAETRTSGEIRVVVARHKSKDPVVAAQAYFKRFRMADSPHRNGILVFVAPRSKNYAVIGDSGVHEKCGNAFWTSLAAAMGDYFRRGDFTDGIVHGVERAGELLAKTFPRSPNDPPPRAQGA
jgi:uncharacterized membrane protein